MTPCELWDLTRPAIPPRSRLYHLEPMGVGTAAAESLTGYLARLAEAHGVSMRTLVVHELLPLLGRAHLSKRVDSSLTAFWQKEARALNGMRLLARDWVQALERQTGREDLPFSTMLTWADVVGATGLLRPQRAWCPACYAEWRHAGQVVYEPLLWALQVVVACPRHRRPLQLQCPYPDCHQSQPLLAPHARPGYCSRCERWLGASPETEPVGSPALSEDEWRWQTWVGDAVGELIAVAPRLPGPPHRESFRAAIFGYMQQRTRGKANVFADTVGVSECAVSSWRRGVSVPRLSFLLQVCYCLGTSPLQLWIDAPAEIDARPRDTPVWNESLRRPRIPHKRFDAERVQQAVEAVLTGDEVPPPPMREVARRLGYAHSYLQLHFPDLCHAISARYRAYRRARGQDKIQRLCGEIREATFRIHVQNLYPSANRVALLLSSPGFIRHPDGIAAWHTALRDLGWET